MGLFIFDAFWVGAYSRGLIKLFDKCHIKSSLSKHLFFPIIQEQSKFKHYSLAKSSSSSGVGAYSRGGVIRRFTVSILYRTKPLGRTPLLCAILMPLYISLKWKWNISLLVDSHQYQTWGNGKRVCFPNNVRGK